MIGDILKQASSKALLSIRKSRRITKESGSNKSLAKASQHSRATCATALDEHDLSATQLDFSSSAHGTAGDNHVASSFFSDELRTVRNNKRITKVTLCDFVSCYEREDLLVLTDILQTSTRKWKQLKFTETIDAANYRRWLFRKVSLRRALDQAIQEAPISEELKKNFPIVFEEHIKIDLDEMTQDGLVTLLLGLQKNRHVTRITMEGFLKHETVNSLMGPLVKLLTKGDRQWEDVTLRVSFDGDAVVDYPQWNTNVTMARDRLQDISCRRQIPIDFQIC